MWVQHSKMPASHDSRVGEAQLRGFDAIRKGVERRQEGDIFYIFIECHRDNK